MPTDTFVAWKVKTDKTVENIWIGEQCLEFKAIHNFAWTLCSSFRPSAVSFQLGAVRSTWLPTWPKPNDCWISSKRHCPSTEHAFIGLAKYKFESRFDLVPSIIEMVDIASSPNCEWKSEIMWCARSRDLVKDFDLLTTVVIRCRVRIIICVCVLRISIVMVVFHRIRKKPSHIKNFWRRSIL